MLSVCIHPLSQSHSEFAARYDLNLIIFTPGISICLVSPVSILRPDLDLISHPAHVTSSLIGTGPQM